jgi:hypothetical protein
VLAHRVNEVLRPFAAKEADELCADLEAAVESGNRPEVSTRGRKLLSHLEWILKELETNPFAQE